MTFTATPPTTPGFYAWRESNVGFITLCKVVQVMSGKLSAHAWCVNSPVELMDGQWCRLVPADEIEKAWIECVQSLGMSGDAGNDFNGSRAKRVMEGLV